VLQTFINAAKVNGRIYNIYSGSVSGRRRQANSVNFQLPPGDASLIIMTTAASGQKRSFAFGFRTLRMMAR
jgi:hypothetical protein